MTRPLSFHGIQYLRGVAALMVAYLHLTIQIPAYESLYLSELGAGVNLASGVDIFFVISGFIMVFSAAGDAPGRFLVRRLIRVVPLYWVMTLVVLLGFLLVPQAFRTTVVSVEYVFKSLFFVPYANPGRGEELVPILVPGWSLNFEMAFYAIFAISLYLPASARMAGVGLFFAALMVLRAVLPEGTLPRAAAFYLDPKILEFWLGMLIAGTLSWSARLRAPGWVIALTGAAALVILLLSNPIAFSAAYSALGFVIIVVPAALVVWSAVAMEQRKWVPRMAWLHAIGDASYSIYLSHILVLGILRSVWTKAGLGQVDLGHAVAFAVISLLGVTLTGWLVYRHVEKPLLKWMRRWTDTVHVRRNAVRNTPDRPASDNYSTINHD